MNPNRTTPEKWHAKHHYNRHERARRKYLFQKELERRSMMNVENADASRTNQQAHNNQDDAEEDFAPEQGHDSTDHQTHRDQPENEVHNAS